MKSKKKWISILVLVAFLLSIVNVPVLAAGIEGTTEETPTSGDCSRLNDDTVTWNYDSSTKTLTISGSGAMKSFAKDSAVPWYDYMKEIETAVIENGVTNVGSRAFNSATALSAVSLANTVTAIEDDAFHDCTSLKAITLPDSLTSIGSAFQSSGLTSIDIPAGVTSIGNSSFTSAKSLAAINVDSANKNYKSIDGVLFDTRFDDMELMLYPAGKQDTSYTVPNGTVHISNLENEFLSELYLNDGLESFHWIRAPKLTEMKFPASVKEIQSTLKNNVDLDKLYFYGNAPTVMSGQSVSSSAPCQKGGVVYYVPGTTGWDKEPWKGWAESGDIILNTWDGGTTPDPTAPAKIEKLTPANGAVDVGYDATTGLPAFYITFDKTPYTSNGAGVQVDSTKEPIAIYTADGTEVWKDNDYGHEYSTHLTLSSDRKTVAVTPTNAHALLKPDTEYYITMGEGYIKFPGDAVGSPAIEADDWIFKTMTAPFTNTHDVTFATGDSSAPTAVVSANWNDSWFKESALVYNHDLARTAMALSGATYVDVKDTAIEAALTELCGFEKDSFKSYNYDYNHTESDNDVVAYSFACKTVYDNGKQYPLVAVMVKGTSGNEEWYSNFNMGTADVHKGFRLAKEELKSSLNVYLNKKNIDIADAKFLVTGHSRGAAVANLIAKDLSDQASTEHVYAYTFATPTVSTEGTGNRYHNIYNIVSGTDFVTRVPLAKWDFKHYGIDLQLPTRSYYGSGYQTVYAKMAEVYGKLTGKKHPEYKDGTLPVDNLVDTAYDLAPSLKEYYEKDHVYTIAETSVPMIQLKTTSQYFNRIASFLVEGPGVILAELYGTLEGEYAPITLFFGINENGVLTHNVLGAHAMATYYSWMDSCTAEELFGAQPGSRSTAYNFKRMTVACPVDVFVTDEAGNMAACVVDEVADMDNPLAVEVKDGVKTIDLPGDQNYSVKIVARDGGTVEYTVKEYVATGLDDTVLRTVGMDAITIVAGDTLTGNVNDIVNTPAKNYTLLKKDTAGKETAIPVDYDSSSQTTPSRPSTGGNSGGFSGSYNYPVKADDVDGATVSFDKSNAVAGDKVIITVTPDSGKQVDEVIVTDADNEVIAVTKVGDNKYSFIMPEGAVKVAVTTEKADYDIRVVLQIGNRNVVVGNKTFTNDVAPVIVGDRTMVPIRVITEALGGVADWNEAARTVTLTIDGKVLRMTIDQTITGFDAAPVIINNRTYVPIRYVAEALGANVEWIADVRQTIVEK